MSARHRFTIALAAAGIATAGLSAGALSASEPLGQHVSACAQMHLGQRADAPQVTCTHDGDTVTFANFGAMVGHMRMSG